MRLALAALLSVVCLAPALAQNVTCQTRPIGDASAACASDQFVQQQLTATTTNPAITGLTGDVAATGPGSAAATIQPGVVTAAKIAAATITSAQIASGTITGGNIASATITSGNIASGTITGGNIAASTLTGSNIAAATVTGSNIAPVTVTGSNIASATITGGNISAATVTNSNLSNMSANTVKCNNTGLSATPTDCTDIILSSPTATNPVNQLSVAVNGANPLSPPSQISPFSVPVGIGGSYTDSGTGNLFQLSSWLDTTGSRPTVAVFGQGRGNGATSSVWGGNFVGVANASGAVGRGVEIDFEVQASGGQAFGIVVGNVSSFANTGAYIQFNSNQGAAQDGIVINNGGVNPITGSLIRTNGAVAATNGIDFSSATFSGTTIKWSPSTVTANGATSTPTLTAVLPTAATATTIFEWLTFLDSAGNKIYVPAWH